MTSLLQGLMQQEVIIQVPKHWEGQFYSHILVKNLKVSVGTEDFEQVYLP